MIYILDGHVFAASLAKNLLVAKLGPDPVNILFLTLCHIHSVVAILHFIHGQVVVEVIAGFVFVSSFSMRRSASATASGVTGFGIAKLTCSFLMWTTFFLGAMVENPS